MLKPILLLNLAISLSACSFLKPKIDEHLSTRISDDGTKFFTYTLVPPQQNTRSDPGSMLYGKRLPPELLNRIESKIAKKKAGKMKAMDKKIEGRLEDNLADINYCHNGYYILEKNTQPDGISIKGECKDGASQLDRDKFGITHYF